MADLTEIKTPQKGKSLLQVTSYSSDLFSQERLVQCRSKFKHFVDSWVAPTFNKRITFNKRLYPDRYPWIKLVEIPYAVR